MEHEVSSFLDQQQQLLSTTLSSEDLHHRIESIIQSLLDPPTSYSEEVNTPTDGHRDKEYQTKLTS